MNQNSKVAMLFIAAIAGLVGIIFLLTGGIVRNATTLYITYNFAGGVQTGTPVRVAGIQVGKVRKIEFLGGDPAQDTHVKLTIDVDAKALESIREDSQFYINMAGIIGERYVEVSTGSKDKPQVKPKAVIRGVDPPRLDQLISQGYGVMGELLDILEKNRGKIEKIIAALDAFLVNFDPSKFGDVAKLVGNLSHLVAALDKDLPPLLAKAGPMMDDLGPVLKNAAPLLADARALLSDVRGVLKDKSLGDMLKQMLSMLDTADSMIKNADHLLVNLQFVDENWIRHFLQVEGIRAYAGLGSPNIPKGSKPVDPPPLKHR